MKLLAIDTATEACSAALLVDGVITSRYQLAPRQHTALILSMIDELLNATGIKLMDLDALAYGRGPGAFTGVRVATGVIQGLAYGSDLPVIPVSTLAALAQGVVSRHPYIISAIDARMGEVYWCLFEANSAGLVSAISDETVTSPLDLRVNTTDIYYGAGSGWGSYPDVLASALGDQLSGYDGGCYPHAKDIIILAAKQFDDGDILAAADALPVYVRNKVTG